jgi:uncharacterized protein YjbJ (UPF0337 family)
MVTDEPDGGTMSDVDNKAEQAKGRVKQAAGDLTGDDSLRREGKVDEASGKAKDALDDVKDKAEGMIDKVKDKIDRR